MEMFNIIIVRIFQPNELIDFEEDVLFFNKAKA